MLRKNILFVSISIVLGFITHLNAEFYSDSNYTPVSYKRGRIDAVDKYATDGYALNKGLKTRIAQKSYMPDATSDPNKYSVDVVYVGEDNTTVETYNAANMPVFLYLANEDCTLAERLRDDTGKWLTAIIKKGETAGFAPAFTLNNAHRDKRLVMRYIDYKALLTSGGPDCLKTSATVPGLPSCVTDDDQYKNAFHQEAFDRCKAGNGAPCDPRHHGYSGGGNPGYPGYTKQYDHRYGCYECTLGTTPGVCSSDNFAIRPDYFKIGITDIDAPHLLRAGKAYPVSLTAYDADDSISNDFNVTSFNENLHATVTRYFKDGTEDTNNLLQGTPDINTSVTAYSVAGLSRASNTVGVSEDIVPIAYDDVGLINFQIYDQNWSMIDNDDTPSDCDDSHAHTYICGELNTTFIPHHFAFAELNISNSAGPDSHFTYVANNRGMPISTPLTRSPMAARVHSKIEARNQQDGITQNFRENFGGNQYYENNISVTQMVKIPTVRTLPNDPNAYRFGTDANTSKIDNRRVGFGRESGTTDDPGTRNIKWDESTYPLDFNFKREMHKGENPFDVNGTYYSIGLISKYIDPEDGDSAVITGSRVGEHNVTDATAAGTPCIAPPTGSCVNTHALGKSTFYYGRAQASKFFYEDITGLQTTTPITINVYCALTFVECENFGINIVNGQLNERNWWLSWSHNSAKGDGNITIEIGTILEGAGAPKFRKLGAETNTLNVDITEAKDEDIQVVGHTTKRPITVHIELVNNLNTFSPHYTATPPYTNSWLIYNESTDALLQSMPMPFYKVRFINKSGWTGVGNTANVLGTDASAEKTHRLNW